MFCQGGEREIDLLCVCLWSMCLWEDWTWIEPWELSNGVVYDHGRSESAAQTPYPASPLYPSLHRTPWRWVSDQRMWITLVVLVEPCAFQIQHHTLLAIQCPAWLPVCLSVFLSVWLYRDCLQPCVCSNSNFSTTHGLHWDSSSFSYYLYSVPMEVCWMSINLKSM